MEALRENLTIYIYSAYFIVYVATIIRNLENYQRWQHSSTAAISRILWEISYLLTYSMV